VAIQFLAYLNVNTAMEHTLVIELGPRCIQGCLVPTQKIFTPSHRMFRHMHGLLNVDEKKLIVQFGWKPGDKSFKPN
jgi:hypothetical protein